MAAQASQNPKRKMKIAFTPGSIGVKASQQQAIDLAHYYGFEAVQPFAADLAGYPLEKRRELPEELASMGLVWAAAGLGVDFRRDAETFDTGLKKWPAQTRVLEEAGVSRVGTWLMPTHDSLTYLQNFRQTARRLREVAAIAEDHGLRLGLEYVGTKSLWSSKRYPFLHTMTEAKELIAEIGQPNVGFVLDSWHWWTAGDTVEDLLSLTNDDVVSCDLNDAPAGIPKDKQHDTTRELPAATGVINLRDFLGALVKIGYDGPVRAEPFNRKLNDMPTEQACAATIEAMQKAFALIGG
jgi:sugar phosphate isomerase/epimerase